MSIPRIVTAVICAVLLSAPTFGASERETRWIEVDLTAELPRDLTDPEGRTRWDLTRVPTARLFDVVIGRAADGDGAASGFLVERRGTGVERMALDRRAWRGATNDGDAELWLLPDRAAERLSSGTVFDHDLLEIGDAGTVRRRIQVRHVGLGWLHLPSGPREVVLQRALVLREIAGGRGFMPESVVHRWVDPRAGVVAEVSGPAAADGTTRTAVETAAVIEQVVRGGAGLKIYVQEIDAEIGERLAYGFDRRGVCTVGGNACDDDTGCTAGGGDVCTIPVSILTPVPHATIGALASAGSWDFSGNTLANSRAEIATTSVAVSSDETCSFDKCGFTRPNAKLGREDKNFDDPPNADITTSVTEFEQRAGDATVWLRAGIRKEGLSGGLGEGESRICYVDSGRTPVPLWRFSHQDGSGWYMQNGDAWSSDSDPLLAGDQPFLCENNIFNHVCPSSCGLFCPIYARDCSGFSGTQASVVVNEGPVTLPSGHTFNSLVIRNAAEFCVYLGSGCSFAVDQVRTVIYLWVVPNLGTVARLMSPQVAASLDGFSQLDEVDIKFGLYPPRTISVGAVTDSSIEISWDPGLDTRRIDGYRIYWDTDSGAATPYANSVDQAAVDGTTATIAGLTAGTTYYVTVTALSEYANPVNPTNVLQYESVLYPTTVPGSAPVPLEVSASTSGGGCTPTTEVGGLTVDRASGGDIELCWDPVIDACADGYQILGAPTPESDAGYSIVVADTGLTTCATLTPAHAYYLVVAKGADGATGPWGHYDR